jgi:hypothetical protein
MSQHDFNIANQTAVNARTDINNALVALATNSSGSSAPSTTFANMFWYETDTNKLWMRNEANTAWIAIGELDQTNNSFSPYVGGFVVTRLSSTKIGFSYGGANKMSLDSSGNLKVSGNITAYTTP